MIRFRKKSDYIILDTKIGLEWQKDSTGPMTWQEAIDYATSLGDGWRVPTIEELFTLIDYSRRNPASSFPNMPSKIFWSSSSVAGDPGYTWLVAFNFGIVSHYVKDSVHYVRYVRRSRSTDSLEISFSPPNPQVVGRF